MKIVIYFLGLLVVCQAKAKLHVITTTSSLESLVKEIGQDKVEVSSLTKKNQDPHFVEAKPSYMVKLRKADLLVAVGLDLEVGWLGNIQRGAKNPKLLSGNRGFFSAGDHIKAIEVQDGKVDRSHGDVHPYGNPHFHLDPNRMTQVAQALAKKMAELDAANSEFYQSNAKSFNEKIKSKMPLWQIRVKKTGIKSIITYHKSFNYFLKSFNLVPVANIEPKPGIPPTAKHILYLINKVKQSHVKCILNENYFETTAAERIKKEAKANLQVVPVEVQSNYFDLIETLVVALENCSKGDQ